jgi:hypothetical protein
MEGASVLYDFQFFVILVNWMILLWYILFFLWRDQVDNLFVLIGRVKGGLTVYIILASLSYILFLAPDHNATGLLAIINTIHRYLIPVIFTIDYFATFTRDLQWRSALEWVVFPMLYIAYAILLGADSGSYMYFFLDLNDPTIGLTGFIISFVILVALFWVVGILIILYNKRFMQPRKVKQRSTDKED